MAGFARWCFLQRKAVLAGWLIALIGFFAVGRLAGTAYSSSYSMPGTDSTQALNVLQADYPALAGDSDQIVLQARQGTLRAPAAQAAVTSMLARVADLPYMRSVTSPYGPGGRISKDGTVGLAAVPLTVQASHIPDAAVRTLMIEVPTVIATTAEMSGRIAPDTERRNAKNKTTSAATIPSSTLV